MSPSPLKEKRQESSCLSQPPPPPPVATPLSPMYAMNNNHTVGGHLQMDMASNLYYQQPKYRDRHNNPKSGMGISRPGMVMDERHQQILMVNQPMSLGEIIKVGV